jgi:hypothetical protein
MAVDDELFESLLQQVRHLHRLTDELRPSTSTRVRENVRARLNWESEPPALPGSERSLADEAVDVLAAPRLSSWQARQLRRTFFGK